MLGGFGSAGFDSVNYVPSECPNRRNYSVGRSRVPRIVMCVFRSIVTAQIGAS